MNYKNIAPPFTLEFTEMTKKELRDHYNWFLSVIPDRIKILTEAVKTTRGFKDWEADCTPESLDKLGEWFSNNVETEKMTKEEKEKRYYKNAPDWFRTVDVGDEDLTIRTISLCHDIGMYLSQVFLKNIRGIEWYLHDKGTKRFVDYGQPVLKGFGKVPFNPVRMCITLAYGLVDKSKASNRLRELYEIWKKIAEENN